MRLRIRSKRRFQCRRPSLNRMAPSKRGAGVAGRGSNFTVHPDRGLSIAVLRSLVLGKVEQSPRSTAHFGEPPPITALSPLRSGALPDTRFGRGWGDPVLSA